MGREVRLSQLEEVFSEFEYPVSREDAAGEVADVTVQFADGEANLGKLVSKTGSESYRNTRELTEELNNTLPRGAVGEPYQSEGEG